MYFDDYSTSFQSLYKPMYNMSTNYNVTGGVANGAGSAVNANATGGYAGGWMMNPLSNVGVGQFGPNQLLQNNEQRNNYYARPIAAHKKKDELPTILGIVGTTLGTAALLVALAKGRKAVKVKPGPKPAPQPGPKPGPQPGPKPGPKPGPQSGPQPGPQSGPQPGPQSGPQANTIQVVTGKVPYAPKYINVNPNTMKYAPTVNPVLNPGPQANTIQVVTGKVPYVPKYINVNPNTMKYAPSANPVPQPGPQANTIQVVTGKVPYAPKYINVNPNTMKYVPSANQASQSTIAVNGKITKEGQDALKYVSNHQFNAGLAKEARRADARAAFSAENYTAQGLMTPEAQEAYNRVLGQQFKPNWNEAAQPLKRSVRNQMKADARAAFSAENHIAQGKFTPEAQDALRKVQGQQFNSGLIKDARRKDAYIAFSGSNYTAQGKIAPQGQDALRYVSNHQFNADLAREARRADARAAFSQLDDNVLAKVNANLNTIRQDIANKGSVVYTTHTNPTFNEGYSLGANAKGSDKLAELLKQMQG